MTAKLELPKPEPQLGLGELSEVAWRGVESCRQGDWQEGMYCLSLVAEEMPPEDWHRLPSLFFAYLGYGLAKYRGQVQEGLRLCRQAVELEFYQPENYFFLAQTWLLTDDRRAAIDAIDRGLEIDATHFGLVALKKQLGLRRPPIFPFLSRQHFVNRTLGRIRHRLLQDAGPRP